MLTTCPIFFNRKYTIKKNVENEKDFFYNRLYLLEDSFCLAFYEQSLESTVADAYEFFAEMDCENNFFADNIILMTPEKGRKLFKLTAMYHTVQALCFKKRLLHQSQLQAALFYVYDFNQKEEQLFHLFVQYATYYPAQFPGLFARAFIKYLFGYYNKNPFILAFVENFCFCSYHAFIQSFTRYVSLPIRMKNAKQYHWHTTDRKECIHAIHTRAEQSDSN